VGSGGWPRKRKEARGKKKKSRVGQRGIDFKTDKGAFLERSVEKGSSRSGKKNAERKGLDQSEIGYPRV